MDLIPKAKIEEVVVTARKRSERLQDVPASIGVLTKESIEERGFAEASDYLRGFPGANQTENGGSQTIVIRGLEANTQFQGTRGGETTGTYFGETATTGIAGPSGSSIDVNLVDVERVEVLRGPQGTAFGSSSLGGTVRIIPAAPMLNEVEGKLGVGYSTTSGYGGDNHKMQAVANIPLIQDKFAVRAVGYLFSDSGYYRNRAGSDAAFQATTVVPGSLEAFAFDQGNVGAKRVTGGRLSALLQATDNLRFTFTYLTQDSTQDGIAVAVNAPYEQLVLNVVPQLTVRDQLAGAIDHYLDLANAVVEYDLGWADLLGTYSYTNGKNAFSRPHTSFGLTWGGNDLYDSDKRQHQGEVRITSKLAGPLNFLAGIYGEKNTTDYRTGLGWSGDPSFNIFLPGAELVYLSSSKNDTQQKAAFGELYWEMAPGLVATGGVRAFETRRGVTYDIEGTGPGFNPAAPTPPAFEDTGETFRASLSYKPFDQALVYGGWSQGFRPGRSTTGVNAATCDRNNDGIIDGTNTPIESTTVIDADSVDSYELGTKFSALDGRINIDATVYRMKWSGVPATVIAPCAASYATNAGTAKVDGMELQASLRATDALGIDLGASYANARITEGSTADFPVGKRLPGAPKVNANLGIQQDFSIGRYPVFIRGDATYVGSSFGEIQNLATTRAPDYLRFDATTRLTLDNISIDLYVKNITNEDGFVSRGVVNLATFGSPWGDSFGYRLRPRTVGIQFGYTYK